MVSEAPSGAFVMHGAREVPADAMVHLQQQVVAIEKAVDGNPGLAFDLSKTLIESACKTILTNRGHMYDEGWDLPKLLRETTNRLRLVPDGCEDAADVTGSLRKTLGGLQTVIQGICEMRNTQGFASHGREGSTRQLDTVQALLVARSADTIVNFLFRVHGQYTSTKPTRRLAYTDHPEFNQYVDEANEVVRIFDLEYPPSEVLFNIDQQAYRDLQASYVPDDMPEEGAPLEVAVSNKGTA